MAILIERADGGVSILHLLSPNAVADEEVAKWRTTNPGYLAHRPIDGSAIPADRTFRNAWKHDLTVDMPKARDLWRDRMRVVRASKLAELDVAYQRADEAGDNAAKASITQRKQALRDVTNDPAIEAATTPEQLKAVWPAVLG